MTEKFATINVFQSDTAGFARYEIACEDNMTVFRALEKVYFEQDRRVGFRHYTCRVGRCASCLVKVNGKNVYGCKHIVAPGAELFVEPMDGKKVIRDLVVAWGDEPGDE